MSDFVFSTHNTKRESIERAVRSIYLEDAPEILLFHGDWGCLAATPNLYYGYAPYETENDLVVVLGSPVLDFVESNHVPQEGEPSETRAILERLLKNSQTKWDTAASGPFVIFWLNKQNGTVQIVTDMMAFIPVFEANIENKPCIIGSHVDVVARVAELDGLYDPTSSADFVLNGYVTYPYTFYTHIRQLAPGSVHNWSFHPIKSYRQNSYWAPQEYYQYRDIYQAGNIIRESLKRYISCVTKGFSRIASFVSGGEDSRVVLSLLPEESERHGYVFLDSFNREGKIAQKAAESYGVKFHFHKRELDHYINSWPFCCALSGHGHDLLHIHNFDFHKRCNLMQYPAVFGGYFADALLKGTRIRKHFLSKMVSFFPKIKDHGFSQGNSVFSDVIGKNVRQEIKYRHLMHYKKILELRPNSADEWFELWPASMNLTMSYFNGNRRLFRSYEPFLSHDIVKISANLPQHWKLNRRVFHAMAKPLLRKTKHLFHSQGWMPYYPWYMNFAIHGSITAHRRFKDLIGLKNGGFQGPWADWRRLFSSTNWKRFQENLCLTGVEPLGVFTESIETLIKGTRFTQIQKLHLLQALYYIKLDRYYSQKVIY